MDLTANRGDPGVAASGRSARQRRSWVPSNRSGKSVFGTESDASGPADPGTQRPGRIYLTLVEMLGEYR